MIRIHRLVVAIGGSFLASLSLAAPGPEPAATLLLPYFEVDLADPGGATTLFSVNNAGGEPVVAHVVTWTDWGIPTYSFDVVLGPDDVQTINLRDLFRSGTVPATLGRGLLQCNESVVVPPLGEAGLEALARRHSGRPDPADGLCWSSGRLGPDLATGYVTIDVIKGCLGERLVFPTSTSYLWDANADLAILPNIDYANVLWGDAFYVSAAENSAQGIELVPIPYDPAAEPGQTFYRDYVPAGEDGRVALGSSYRSRFLDGGPFDGGTDLLVWLENSVPSEPLECGTREQAVRSCTFAAFGVYDEDGNYAGGTSRRPLEVAFRLPVSAERPESLFPPAVPQPPFGLLQLDYYRDRNCGIIFPVEYEPRQAWLTVVMKARGRYSVALSGTRVPFFGAEP